MTWRIPSRFFTHDLWAPLSHIAQIGSAAPDGARPPDLPTWLDDDDARRLMAYRVLTAYRTNVRRMFLPDGMWQGSVHPGAEGGLTQTERPPAESYREYGHGALLVETTRAIVLGDEQTITVPALADTDPADPAGGPARAALDWWTDWATRERLQAKLLVQEDNSVGDGDGILVVSWSTELGRPVLRTYDPGFYFPDLLSADRTPGWVQEYPPIVHLAWEYDTPDGVRMLRRYSWRMVRLEVPVASPWGGQRVWTCWYEAAEWRLDRIRDKTTVYTLQGGQAGGRWITEPEDLGIDFIPVVHVPNTETSSAVHFGTATPLLVAQILDDLSGSDTDVARTAESAAAGPALFTGMGSARDMPAGPDRSWWGPEGSSAGFVDTSKVMVAGLEHNKHLIEALAVNSRLSLSLIGRVSPTDAVSGYAMALGFAPARALMRQLRLVRSEKHPLILKFAYRLAQARGALPGGSTPAGEIDLGPGLPSDLALAVEQARTLLTQPAAISTATAVRMLMAAGLPIPDAEAEVAAIRAENTAAAVQLVEATGDVPAARAVLGLPEAGPVLPAPVLPPEPSPGGP
jgi:hypothetical protein